MKDTIQTIRRSSHRFFSGTLLSRISGMLRDMSMAYAFGTQSAIAAFMVAFRFAHLLRRLFGEGALQSAFIPEFESLRHQSAERAILFFRDLTRILSLVLTILIGVGMLILFAFLQWGELQPGNQEIVSLTLLMLPSLLFICLFGLNASLLQCEKSYFIPSVAPVAFNGIWIVAVFYLKDIPTAQAMPWLSLGVILACFCQWLLTVPLTRQSVKKVLTTPTKWKNLFSFTPDLRQLIKPLALGMLGVAAAQINNAVDSVFARYAESEGPAFLWYAIRIQQLPLALFGIAIAGAVLPPLSRALKARQWDQYHHFLQDALQRTWLFMLPLTALLFLVGDLSVSLLYGRGDFGFSSVTQTTSCLWAYGAGLLPSALVLVLAPACYAQSNYSIPSLASISSLIINVILNSLFIVVFHWGAVSVALATSVSALANVLILTWHLSRSGTPVLTWLFQSRLLIINLSTLCAFIGSFQLRAFFFQQFSHSNSFFFDSFFTQSLTLISQTSCFGIIFFTIRHLLTTLFCNRDSTLDSLMTSKSDFKI